MWLSIIVKANWCFLLGSWILSGFSDGRQISEDDMTVFRNRVVQMFQHAYNSYLTNAYPYDELRPLSCDGMDTWGSFSLTLIDALDTLAVMGNYSEFRRVAQKIISTANFNININVSVFETNIRVIGGLISAHLLSHKAGMDLEPGWPCSGPLLRLAENVARKILPAFQSKTGMPYGTVNLYYGVPPGETPITCTAGVSTFIVEFGALSRLTGDPVFEKTALRALEALWNSRSSVGLVGNHINVQDGKWTALDAGIGAGVDSYYEYLVKGAILLQKPQLMKMFKEYYQVITKYMKRDDWYLWVSMGSGQVTMPVFQSLEAYWPGLLSLVGDLDQALKSLYNYHQVWRQYGFTPEFYDIVRSQVNSKREGYPLRPEFAESVMYLYRATKDPYLLEIGIDILESIQYSAKTECGYATIKNVQDHRIEDRMESFFLAETTKYLYLLFDPTNFLHNNGSCGEVISTTGGDCVIGAGGYVFNTEAHPIDSAAVYCCSAQRKVQEQPLQDFQNNMNLFSLLEIGKKIDFFKDLKKNMKKFDIEENCLDGDMCNNADDNSEEEDTEKSESSSNHDTVSLDDDNEDDEEDDSFLSAEVNIIENTSTFIKESTKDKLVNNIPENSEKLLNTNSNARNVDDNIVTNLRNSVDVTKIVNIPDLFPTTYSPEDTQDIPELKSDSDDALPLKQKEVDSSESQNKHSKEWSVQPPPEDIVTISNSVVIPSTSAPFKVIPPDPLSDTLSDNLNKKDTKDDKETNKTVKKSINFEILSCPAQPFISRLALMGQMFNTD